MNTLDAVRLATFRVIARDIVNFHHRVGFIERLDRVRRLDGLSVDESTTTKWLDSIERDLIANGYFSKDEA